MKHLIRMFSALLVLALVIAAVPSANAFTLGSKVAAPPEKNPFLNSSTEVGGTADLLYAGEAGAAHTVSPGNSSPATADVAELNSTWTGTTSASNREDYFKITLAEDKHVLFASVSTGQTMNFGLFSEAGAQLAQCEYYGTSAEDGLFIDAISCALKAGTYYIMVIQSDFEGVKAYSQQVTYALEFHAHDYTVSVTKEATCTETGTRRYTCGCGFYYEETIPASHNFTAGTPVPPTCTEEGYTPYTCTCGATEKRDKTAALGHDWDKEHLTAHPDKHQHSYACRRCDDKTYIDCSFEYDSEEKAYVCPLCGNVLEDVVYRISGKTRVETSMAVADALKAELKVDKFQAIVVASASNFPDALSGSYLAIQKDAPILLMNYGSLMDTATYITQNLSSSGVVYILGGESAVSKELDNLLGILLDNQCIRLSGKSRYETNLKILDTAGVGTDERILICTGNGFADSLSASASGLPIMLVGDSLTKEQKDFLAATSKSFTIIGGSSAVSEAVEQELAAIGSVVRIKGASRYETSTQVAQTYYPAPSRAVLAYAQNYPDGLCGGPLAYAMSAPLILTDRNYASAQTYLSERSVRTGFVLGGSILVEDNVVRTLFGLPENTPIFKK